MVIKHCTLSIHLQLGLVVLPCFVKGLLYILQKHRRTNISPLRRGHWEDGVIWIFTRLLEIASLCSRFMPCRTASERPCTSSCPNHPRFTTQLLAAQFIHITGALFTCARFTVHSFSLESALPPSLHSRPPLHTQCAQKLRD